MHDPKKSQSHHPYPRGQGTASVPVLFTLRNVQPSIIAGMTERKEGPPTATQSVVVPLAPVPVATSPKPIETPRNTRSPFSLYNIVVLALIATVVGLAFQNSRGRREGTTGSVVRSSEPISDGGQTAMVAPANAIATRSEPSSTIPNVPLLASKPNDPFPSIESMVGTSVVGTSVVGNSLPTSEFPRNTLPAPTFPPSDRTWDAGSTAAKPPATLPLLLSPSGRNDSNAIDSNTTDNSRVYAPARLEQNMGAPETASRGSGPYGTATSYEPTAGASSNNTNYPGNLVSTDTPDIHSSVNEILSALNERRQAAARTVASTTGSPVSNLGSPSSSIGSPASLGNMEANNQAFTGQAYPPPQSSFQPIPVSNRNPSINSNQTKPSSYASVGQAALATSDPDGSLGAAGNRYAQPRFIQQPSAPRPYAPIGAAIPNPNGIPPSTYTPIPYQPSPIGNGR